MSEAPLRLNDGGRDALRQAAPDIVTEFRGPNNPKLSTLKDMRWGAKGSFSLILLGPKQGCWYDHEAQCGGDIVEFIQFELNCSFADALDYAGRYVPELRNARTPAQPLPRLPRPAPQIVANKDDDQTRTAAALAAWRQTVPLSGTLAETYLRSRGIEVPDEALDVLRFHPACPWGAYAGPCMVALVTDIVSDEPVAIHRTALTADGRKFGRMSLGPTGSGAIKLTPQASITTELAIAEGIETALSAAILGFGPVWSVIDAGGITRFPVLPSLKMVQMFGRLAGIERLTIMADNDLSGTGQRAALVAQTNWEGCGVRVRIVTPSIPGHDANDVLKALKGRP